VYFILVIIYKYLGWDTCLFLRKVFEGDLEQFELEDYICLGVIHKNVSRVKSYFVRHSMQKL
jgi:hypothetical protein